MTDVDQKRQAESETSEKIEGLFLFELVQGGVENVQYATTIKERGEEALVRSTVKGLPHTSSPVSSSRSSCRASTS